MNESLGQFIRRRLGELDRKQADLVKCTGLSPTYVSYLINDTAPTSKKSGYLPEPDKLATLARCLECSAVEILAAMNYLPASELGDVEEKRLIERFRRMPDNIKEVYALIGQTFDRKYAGKVGVANPNVLPASDEREATHDVTSALTLTPQEDGSEGNGESNSGLEVKQSR
jgi:transcriptional regulator with XRE-family HTH domain